MIPLGNKDPDAIRLLNWKRPTERDVRTKATKPPDTLKIIDGAEILW